MAPTASSRSVGAEDRQTHMRALDRPAPVLTLLTELSASTPPSVKGTRKSNLPQGCCESQVSQCKESTETVPTGPRKLQ